MTEVTVLFLDATFSSTATGPMEVFRHAGTLWNVLTGKRPDPRFHVTTASVDGRAVRCDGDIKIQPDAALAASAVIGYTGEVWRIHPSRPSADGQRYFRSVDELPRAPDAAFIAAPNREVPAIARALAMPVSDPDNGDAVVHPDLEKKFEPRDCGKVN